MKKITWTALAILFTLLFYANVFAARGIKDSFESMKPLCDKDVSHSCFKIGERFRTLDRDNKKALPYFEKACNLGHYTACSHAGIILMMRGTPYSKEFKKAKIYFQSACDKKHDKACYNLGSLFYKEGRQKKAIKFFDMSCELGNGIGCGRSAKLK